MGIDFETLAEVFNQWAKHYVEVDESQWCGIDGKSIRGTVCDCKTEYQNFVSIVSVFASQRGLVVVNLTIRLLTTLAAWYETPLFLLRGFVGIGELRIVSIGLRM
jgi:hypothetical protein